MMFDKEAWDRNEWVDSKDVEKQFDMTFGQCLEVFGFNRQVSWCKEPLQGQIVRTYFRKYK